MSVGAFPCAIGALVCLKLTLACSSAFHPRLLLCVSDSMCLLVFVSICVHFFLWRHQRNMIIFAFYRFMVLPVCFTMCAAIMRAGNITRDWKPIALDAYGAQSCDATFMEVVLSRAYRECHITVLFVVLHSCFVLHALPWTIEIRPLAKSMSRSAYLTFRWI